MSGSAARKVYVISDLHLGGEYSKTPEGRGFRINTHARELTEFVDALALASQSGSSIELVINGDMVDFLAERSDPRDGQAWTPFTRDSEAACAKLQSIADRDAGFFKALGAFLENGHRLTILTGNHDVELSLFPVRQKLKEIIGVQPHHNYELISNGEAYVVGDALIEHGNRYDRWNAIDHDRLRRISSLLSRKQSVPKEYEFDPPPGSKLVAWVINQIKEEYKFIDLLKPETDVAVPWLLALEPGYRQILATVAKLALKARFHAMRKAALPGFGGDIHAGPELSAAPASFGSDMGAFSAESSSIASQEADGEAALEEILRNRLPGDSREFLDALPNIAVPPIAGIGGDISAASFVDRSIGMAKLLFSRDDADVGRRLPALLKAFQALQPDRSFDPGHEAAPEYIDAANELFEGGFRFVVFGHTHLAKKIELQPGRWYLNSGTWSDLIQLPQEIITALPQEAGKRLERFVQDMSLGFLKSWIIFRPTYLRLDLDSTDRLIGTELVHYESNSLSL